VQQEFARRISVAFDIDAGSVGELSGCAYQVNPRNKAAELAQQLADGPSWALGQAKRVVYHGYDHSLHTAGEYEGVVIAQSMRGHDGQEGIAAFVEKRRPDFIGE